VKKTEYVIDSFALLAYFQGEAGGLKVRALMKEARAGESSLHLSLINFGEILYIVERRRGAQAAETVRADISRLPVQIAAVTVERVIAAAHLKAHHAISYADAFVVALAQELDATVVTADPEFRKVESQVALLWL